MAPLADGFGDERDDAAVDRLDRVVGRDGHGQRVGEAVPMFAVCGVLPGTIAKVKPWLSKAPMSTPPTRPSPALVGGRGCPAPLVPASIAGLPGRRGMVWRRAAVVAQGSRAAGWPRRRCCRRPR